MSDSNSSFLSCIDIAKEFTNDKGQVICCPSCHDDWEEGYNEPHEKDLPDGRTAFVCCEIAEFIDTHIIKKEVQRPPINIDDLYPKQKQKLKLIKNNKKET